jgi:Kdo2-lipid IVA lauroyltransferase/acyltransferase
MIEMRTILYYLFSRGWYLFSLLPLRILYIFSDAIYFLVYYLIRYRRRIVRSNLQTSFPEKGFKEIIQIEKKYYAWFCDYIAETVKLASMSKKEMCRRMKFEGMDDIEQSIGSDNSCFVYLGHYCNWEWITSLPLHAPENTTFAQIYHALSNPVIDRLFLHLRERFGAFSIQKENTLRQIITWNKAGKQTITGFISDQVPKWNSIHYWTTFMNHDTPVFTGTERIARKLGFSAFYADVCRPKRGYYICRFLKMADNARDTEEFELTETYMRMLEKSIRRDPQFWLWSHNRWKRTHEEFNQKFADAEKRIGISE